MKWTVKLSILGAVFGAIIFTYLLMKDGIPYFGIFPLLLMYVGIPCFIGFSIGLIIDYYKLYWKEALASIGITLVIFLFLWKIIPCSDWGCIALIIYGIILFLPIGVSMGILFGVIRDKIKRKN